MTPCDDDEAAAILGLNAEQFRELANLPAFPRAWRSREAVEEFKRQRLAARAAWFDSRTVF